MDSTKNANGLYTHSQLLEKAKAIKILVRVHIGYQSIKPEWTPDKEGYVYENCTLDGKVEWYRPVNL